MALESATYIDGLVATNPVASDAISTADDHLRLLKSTLKATFPNITGPVTKTQAEINGLAPLASPTFTGTPAAPTASPGTNTTQLATTAFTKAAVDAATSSLGTMSTQAANNVAITGGTITGIADLAVADGGTGRSTLTANNLVVGNGTSAVNFIAPGTNGQVLTSNGTSWAAATLPDQGIGVGQTWQSVSRSLGVDYTNSTGKPIMVAVTTANYFSSTSVYVAGSQIGYSYDSDFGGTNFHTFIVPNGSTYQVAGSSGNTTLKTWMELR